MKNMCKDQEFIYTNIQCTHAQPFVKKNGANRRHGIHPKCKQMVYTSLLHFQEMKNDVGMPMVKAQKQDYISPPSILLTFSSPHNYVKSTCTLYARSHTFHISLSHKSLSQNLPKHSDLYTKCYRVPTMQIMYSALSVALHMKVVMFRQVLTE